MSPMVRGVLGLLARLVPRSRRAGWLREWRAEAARAARPDGGDAPGGGTVLVAALEDALSLRARSLRPGASAMDLRFAFRSLLRHPGFTALVVLTLALGIGSTVTIFSAVRGVALRPLPYERPDGLALVTLAFGHGGSSTTFPASEPEYLELEAENPAFGGLAAYWVADMNLGGTDEPRRVTTVGATANLLDVLGVSVAAGRGLAPDEDRPGADDVVLLSHGLWAGTFGADEGVVGSTILLDGRPRTVVGILPADFEFPGAEVDLVRNLVLDRAAPRGRSSHWLYLLARLAPGTDIDAARATTADLLARWAAERPGRHQPSVDGHPVRIAGLREAMVGELRRPLLLLSGAVGMVLLVACFNVANLLLVRGDDRQREFGVRVAMGAGRPALLRQLLAESAVLAGAGGLAGLLLAWLALGALPGLAADVLPPNAVLAVDRVVLAFAAGVTGLVALLFGIVPVLGAGSDPGGALQAGSGRATAGARRVGFRRLLVVGEVAAAVALVALAGVLGRGFTRVMDVDPGLDPSGVVTLDLELNPATYPTQGDVAAFHGELRRRLVARAGVSEAGAIRTLPLRPGGGWETLTLEGEAPPGDLGGWTVQYQVATPGIFEALGIPLVAGRVIAESDDGASEGVAVLNRAAAAQLFGSRDPLGRRLKLGPADGPNPWLTVVGVVGDVRQAGLTEEAPPQLYAPGAQAGAIYGGMGTREATVVVRGPLEPAALMTLARSEIRSLDPGLPLSAVQTMERQITRSVGDRRLVATLMGVFSVLALALGAVGLYGLLTYVVARRAHEFGIRVALGARGAEVRRRVVGEALALVALGSAAGVAGALLAGGLVRGLVFGVSPRDPAALAAAPALLVLLGILAAWLPARRASGADPARVLRSDG